MIESTPNHSATYQAWSRIESDIQTCHVTVIEGQLDIFFGDKAPDADCLRTKCASATIGDRLNHNDVVFRQGTMHVRSTNKNKAVYSVTYSK